MKIEDIDLAKRSAERKALADITKGALGGIAGFEITVRWPAHPPNDAGLVWPPATLPIFIEVSSPNFDDVKAVVRNELDYEAKEAAATLKSLGVKE